MWGPLLAIGAGVIGFALGFWIRGTYPAGLDDLYDVWGDDAEEAL
jgi:hypothetical protein